MSFADEDKMNVFMDHVIANQLTMKIIRAKAWPEPPRYRKGEFKRSGAWMARIVLRTEEEVRIFYRKWNPQFDERREIKPWR
jgi:hypothetical protein